MRILAVVVAVSTVRFAAAEAPTLAVESGVFSQYVWRGMLETDGPVLENSVTAGWHGAHLNIWTNQDLNSVNGRRGEIGEVDFDAGYDRSLEKAVLSAGMIRYTFPNTLTAANTELYAGAALKMPLRPSAKVFFDAGRIHGTYLTLDVSHTVPLPPLAESATWSIELAAGAGWGSSGYSQAYFHLREPGWVDFHPGIGVPFRFGKHWGCTPRLSYASLARGPLRQSLVPSAHNFVAGVALGFTL